MICLVYICMYFTYWCSRLFYRFSMHILTIYFIFILFSHCAMLQCWICLFKTLYFVKKTWWMDMIFIRFYFSSVLFFSVLFTDVYICMYSNGLCSTCDFFRRFCPFIVYYFQIFLSILCYRCCFIYWSYYLNEFHFIFGSF